MPQPNAIELSQDALRSPEYKQMARKIIKLLEESGGHATLQDVKSNLETETLQSLHDLSIVDPGTVVLGMIADNELYLDPDWNVGLPLHTRELCLS